MTVRTALASQVSLPDTIGGRVVVVLCPECSVHDTNSKGFVRLTRRRLMSYIYGAPILDVPRSHTTTQHSR